MTATIEPRQAAPVVRLLTSDPAVLEVSLFGTPAFRYAGRDVRLNLPRKALRLLAYLLLDRAVHDRERVAFALWPDEDESAARANLRRQLHLLQRALPDTLTPWLLVDTSTVAWNTAAPFRLDVSEFERACASEDTLDAAAALYGGELLAGWSDEWVVPVRERLSALAANTLTELVARLRASGEAARAIVFAQRLRALDPWRENAVRALIGLRYETGDRAGAVAEYERFVRALDEELGVEPMPETQALYEALVDNGPVSPAGAAVAVAPESRRDGMPFVGRDGERARLDAAWARVRDGAGETIVVGGEAGVGKSRLLEEFAAQVEARGGRTMIGRTTSVEALALQAFADALRQALPLVRALPVDPAWLGVLCALVPQLRVARPELPEPPPLSAPQERSRLYEAVAIVLAALAEVRPVLVVLEDLHWAGESTLALFEYVARRIAPSRVLLVGTYCEDGAPRTQTLRDLRRRLKRESLLRTLSLGPLAPEAIAELMRQLLDESPEHCAAIAADLHRRSDGNAFFLHETLRACAACGVFDADRRRWDDDAARRELPVPENLAAWLRARVERLPAHVQSVVEIAAIAGRAFSVELVRDVSGFDERRVLDALDRLIDERIVRETGGGQGDYTFCHQLLRTAVYHALPEPLRRRRHRRIAAVLEQLHPERTGELAIELADHFDRGDEPKRAAAHYARAAANAAAVFANREAIDWARRALDLSDDVSLRLEVITLAETLYGRLGERAAQRAAVTRLVSLATELRDASALVYALGRRVELERACGDRDAERDAQHALVAATARPVPKASDRAWRRSDARPTAAALR